MRTLKYILLSLLLSANLVSCTPDSLEDYTPENTEVVASKGENGDLGEEDEE
ncbi:hypothetical protein GCM10022393_24220 [Aquimarina addita]|uniref:Secreted protein n=1 Tax=Aquimarina addita TaxID=870485 RepID=A0ABP6UMQ0_9FLAO